MRQFTAILVSTIMLCALPGTGEQGLNVFHLGNSLTDEVYGMHGIAESFGYTDFDWARQMIPGAPLHWLWTHQDGGFCLILLEGRTWGEQFESSPEMLRSRPWDVVTMQIYPKNGDGYHEYTLDAVIGFAKYAYQGNPNCQLYIYPGHTGEKERGDPGLNASLFEPIADTLSKHYPDKKQAYVLPTINAFAAMWDEGERDLWTDDGHANANGRYLLSLVFYTALYRQNPAGAIHTDIKWADGCPGVDPAFAATAQRVAFEVVTSYEKSGYYLATGAAQRAFTPARRQAQRQSSGDQPLFSITGRMVPSVSSRAVPDGFYISTDRAMPLVQWRGTR